MIKTQTIWLSLIGIGGSLYSYFSGFTWVSYVFFLAVAILSLVLIWVFRKRERWTWGICLVGTGFACGFVGWILYMQSLVGALFVVIPLGYTGPVDIDFGCKTGVLENPQSATLRFDIDSTGYLKVRNAAPGRPALVVYFKSGDNLYGPLEHEVDHTLPQYVDGECGQRLVFEVFSVPLDSVGMGLKNVD